MIDCHINIFYSEDDNGYIANIPDLDACSAFGETPEEALQEVQKAKDLWLQAAHAEKKTDSSSEVPTGYLSSHMRLIKLQKISIFAEHGASPEGKKSAPKTDTEALR